MLKRLFLLPCAVLLCLTASAQFRYTFKDTTTPYTPLTGATSLNGSGIWVDQNFVAPIPFTWKMDSTFSVNMFNLRLDIPGVFTDTNNYSDLNGILFGDFYLADRGNLSGTGSRSPIRYVTTGTAPNRIFKLELFNAGFVNELDFYSTMDDSVNLQMWVYETSNIIELHYGPSRITYPSDYFEAGSGGPLAGYLKHVDFDFGSAGSIYHVTGNPAAPTLDSFSLPATALPVGLSAWPANGKVYRFTPKWRGCTLPAANFTSGAPAGKTVQYTYNGTTPIDSLRWDFGDGGTSTVMNPSHTFAANGRYNVCVTVYNSCGANTVCKQSALAVGHLAALGNVKVYPNPADNQLTIEGMQAGGKATLLSVVGQQVLSSTISSSRQTINLSGLPAGTYMLLLSDKDGASGSVQIIRQ